MIIKLENENFEKKICSYILASIFIVSLLSYLVIVRAFIVWFENESWSSLRTHSRAFV